MDVCVDPETLRWAAHELRANAGYEGNLWGPEECAAFLEAAAAALED